MDELEKQRMELLITKAESEDLSYLLDELVYDVKCSQAADINNNGPSEQISYLLAAGTSLDEIESALNDPE